MFDRKRNNVDIGVYELLAIDVELRQGIVCCVTNTGMIGPIVADHVMRVAICIGQLWNVAAKSS